MSIGRGFAQVAPKKNFVVDINTIYRENNPTNHGVMFLQSDFDEWYADNSAAITKLGSIYVVKNASNFKNTVDVSSGSSGGLLGHTLGANFFYNNNLNKRTLIDLGKEISIGTQFNSRVLVFRQVGISFEGSNLVGYVVTENNDATLTHPRFYIAVARA